MQNLVVEFTRLVTGFDEGFRGEFDEAVLREKVSKSRDRKQYMKVVHPLLARYAKWVVEHGKCGTETALPPYQPPAAPVVESSEEPMGATITRTETSQRAVRNEIKMLFDIDATREPLRQTYSNALVFRNAFYFVRQDGKIEYRQSIPFDPALQQEDCFRASQEKQRDVLEKAINEFDIQFHLGEIAMVAYDIETYSSTPGVPLPDDPLAHIGMICAAYSFNGVTEKHAFLWEGEVPLELDSARLPANVAVHVDSSEAGMCCAFISWVRSKSAEREIILVGWNSNQQPFQQIKKKADEPENTRPAGYDYPWIMKRCGAFSQTQMAAPYKGSGLACSGQ
ncbi:hypothetical protein PAPYR_11520 [Paratrimastix pyriformis]|uniref:Uncharacterized protein n=1 Tax=Paratrimastix pyriformis TaxID=342808 RepID=A0ABQ8U3L0_9EUKA|nr:hypothetical protein PAPYR_11520 [Paratrimastix pyriformis]